jgi:ATP-binding cassette subfamily B protein
MTETINQAHSQSTGILLLKLYRHISKRRRIQLGFLLVLMLVSGATELISLGAVLPFLTALGDPESLWRQPRIQSLALQLGLTDSNQLLLPMTIVFVIATVLAAVIRLLTIWLSGALAAAIGSDISCEGFRRTLYQPYSIHVQRNSSEIITVLTSQVGRVVSAIGAVLRLISSGVVSIALIIGLLFIDTTVAVAAIAIFGAAYVVIAVTVRKELALNSEKIVRAYRQQVKSLQEGLGAIRDVLLDNKQEAFLRIYCYVDRPQRQLNAKNAYLAAFPRYILECLGMLSVALLGYLLVVQQGSAAAAIPLIGGLALGSQRLLPALQQSYTGWASLRGFNADLVGVLRIIKQPINTIAPSREPLQLMTSICFSRVRFSYKPDLLDVVKGVDFEIYQGERVGLIGITGSGKSTIVDLLMGLLQPTAGTITVDGKNINDNADFETMSSWQRSIAHVPQNIFLVDGTISENIAFGIPKNDIDFERVRESAELAHIASFIESSMLGYETPVGERGIQLSGGQRQRLAIARAFYKRSSVMVLDEATSALDNETEANVINEIENLSRKITLIIIAHRLSTVQSCDKIIKIHAGKIAAIGDPKSIIANANYN